MSDHSPESSSDGSVDPTEPHNLLAQLDGQQNHVMAELDKLNEQIELLLRQCSQQRSTQAA
ncbi:MAG: hypothetical protein KDB27_30600 [Planctomycetales bacterium]|nr:hypothetical protein [Planctomycetales bacterium]